MKSKKRKCTSQLQRKLETVNESLTGLITKLKSFSIVFNDYNRDLSLNASKQNSKSLKNLFIYD
ncbi:hypothetical protein SAMN05444405_104186 [Bacteroides luti]|jgi:hypothetical protein|uniref:Uncharacterized protein n=1 Tax=Bacteroides luti TaxID=1297750 RepID=A0A1M4Y1F0_9BACE|nr:hypothetical protein SAMN05444405_104186 [Bacteroides luti]